MLSVHEIEQRENICARIKADDDTIKADILDLTPVIQPCLINLLDRQTAPPDKEGLAWAVEITSLCRDHGDDSVLGPHGHRHGYSVDMWTSGDLGRFVHSLIWNNKYCTKVGLGGAEAQALYPAAKDGPIEINGTIVFYDNDEPHIHAQSA